MKKKRLYEAILKLNNVEEKYINPYLTLIKEMLTNEEISQKDYNELLQKYSIYAKNEENSENSGESNSKNDSYEENDSQYIKIKIKDFLESLKEKSNLKVKDIKLHKMIFIFLIFQSIRKIKNINYKAIKRVTWKNNQKLYLYTIYCSLVYSFYNRIEY